MSWKNPRWSSISGPLADTLRNIFASLERFLANPHFENGIKIGSGENPTIDPGTGAKIPNSAIRGRRIEISSADANQVQMFSPRTSGGDPYAPGRVWSDIYTSFGQEWGTAVLRAPQPSSGHGAPAVQLDSKPSGAGRVTLGVNGNQMEVEPNQTVIYTPTFVLSDMFVGSGPATTVLPLRATEGGMSGTPSVGSQQCYIIAGRKVLSWTGGNGPALQFAGGGFPNGLVMCMVQTECTGVHVKTNPCFGFDKTQVFVQFWSGAAAAGNGSYTVDYIAIGY